MADALAHQIPPEAEEHTPEPNVELSTHAEGSMRMPQMPPPIPEPGYDFWRGQLDLVAPVRNAVDQRIENAVHRFLRAEPEIREAIRTAVIEDSVATLITYAARAAVFAIRSGDVLNVIDGLTAVSMAPSRHAHASDVDRALALLFYAAKRIDEDPEPLFETAAELADDGVGGLIRDMVDAPTERRDIRAAFGLDEIETDMGAGLIQYARAPYFPTVDLNKLALEAANVIDAGGYCIASVTAAAELPTSWIEPTLGISLLSRPNKDFEAAAKRIRGAVSISARLRPEYQSGNSAQQLDVYIAQAAGVADAQLMERLADAHQWRHDHAHFGWRDGELFCLALAHCVDNQERDCVETQKSLKRFTDAFASLLTRRGASTH